MGNGGGRPRRHRFGQLGALFLKVKRRALGAASLHHANEMLWFFNGNERMRLPVAAKYALRTAGAATQIVGSPTPPQKPPDGMRIVSTFGISAMLIEA